MQRMRQLGKEKMSYRKNSLGYLLAQQNLEDDIPFKGVGL